MSISALSALGSTYQAAIRQNLPGNSLPSSFGAALAAATSASAPAPASASGSAAASSGAVSSSAGSDAASQFESYMKETPAQRMQDAWLRQHGISQQQFAAMSPADKQKLNDQMKADIEAKVKQKTGIASQSSPNIATSQGSTNILV